MIRMMMTIIIIITIVIIIHRTLQKQKITRMIYIIENSGLLSYLTKIYINTP